MSPQAESILRLVCGLGWAYAKDTPAEDELREAGMVARSGSRLVPTDDGRAAFAELRASDPPAGVSEGCPDCGGADLHHDPTDATTSCVACGATIAPT